MFGSIIDNTLDFDIKLFIYLRTLRLIFSFFFLLFFLIVRDRVFEEKITYLFLININNIEWGCKLFFKISYEKNSIMNEVHMLNLIRKKFNENSMKTDNKTL